jgi:hypothetical protein
MQAAKRAQGGIRGVSCNGGPLWVGKVRLVHLLASSPEAEHDGQRTRSTALSTYYGQAMKIHSWPVCSGGTKHYKSARDAFHIPATRHSRLEYPAIVPDTAVVRAWHADTAHRERQRSASPSVQPVPESSDERGNTMGTRRPAGQAGVKSKFTSNVARETAGARLSLDARNRD